jgi:hypothetical protein
MKDKTNIKIPEHDEEAMAELEDCGISCFDYAKYDGNHIIAYKKWGRGWMRSIIEKCEG